MILQYKLYIHSGKGRGVEVSGRNREGAVCYK